MLMKPLLLLLPLLFCHCTTQTVHKLTTPPLQLTVEQHRARLTQVLYTQANTISNIREEQYKAGHYGQSQQEQDADRAFSSTIQQYTGAIESLQTLENLTRYFWELDCPNDMPLDPWTQAEETIKWYLCEAIAQKGTEEAYHVLQRLRDSYSDGAWCGNFRSLEWKYLRSYSQDPVVQQSLHGIFH